MHFDCFSNPIPSIDSSDGDRGGMVSVDIFRPNLYNRMDVRVEVFI